LPGIEVSLAGPGHTGVKTGGVKKVRMGLIEYRKESTKNIGGGLMIIVQYKNKWHLVTKGKVI